MEFDESGKSFNGSACGDNCAKWIMKPGRQRDLTIDLYHVMDFSGEPMTNNTLNKANPPTHRRRAKGTGIQTRERRKDNGLALLWNAERQLLPLAPRFRVSVYSLLVGKSYSEMTSHHSAGKANHSRSLF